MRQVLRLLLVAATMAAATVPGSEIPAELSKAIFGGERVAAASVLGAPPLYFEPNLGQTNPNVVFYARRPEGDVGFTADGVIFRPLDAGGERRTIRMLFEGGEAANLPSGLDERKGRSSYFIGRDRDRWKSGVPHYGRIQYEEFRPNVDLVFYGNPKQLEYDLVVRPGAETDSLGFRFEGVDGLELDDRGDLVLLAGSARLIHRRPNVYQRVGEVERAVDGRFVIREDGVVGFELGAHDPGSELVIDPVIVWATYVGGRQEDEDASIVADADGYVYVVAENESLDFPTTDGVFDNTHNNPDDPEEDDLVIFKLAPDGSDLVFSTFVGGKLSEYQHCQGKTIAVDETGVVYVAGNTGSPDFPITGGAYDTSFNSDDWVEDAVAFKLSANGTQLLYSTFLGGSDHDWNTCLAVDAAGDMYVTGQTLSFNFPTTKGAYDTTFNGIEDLFVTKLRPAGNGREDLLYSSYIGGVATDRDPSVAVDSEGNFNVVAESDSVDFPVTAGAFDETYNERQDVVVLRLKPEGKGIEDLLYSTYFGGSEWDARDGWGIGIDIGPGDDIFIAGETISTEKSRIPFPLTEGAFQTVHGEQGIGDDGEDIFVARIRPEGKGAEDLIYSTFIGGNEDDEWPAIAVDSQGYAYIAAETGSKDFPVVDPMYELNPALSHEREDMTLSVLDPTGSELVFSTMYGGYEDDDSSDIFIVEKLNGKGASGTAGAPGRRAALADNVEIYISGEVVSRDFPVTPGAFDTSYNGDWDLVVLKIVNQVAPPAPGAFTAVSAASYEAPVSPGSIAAGFADLPAEDGVSAAEVPLPTELGGRSVQIVDSAEVESLAPLFYSGRSGTGGTQVNFSVPDGVAIGDATVNLLVEGEVKASSVVEIAPVAPGIFTVGQGVAAAFFLVIAPDGTRTQFLVYDGSLQPAPVDLGPEGQQVYLLMFGTGVRNASSVAATVGGQETPVLGFAPHVSLVGLDQVNLGPLPRSLAGAGAVDVVLTVDGAESNAVKVAVK